MSSLAKALSVAILMGTVGQAAAVENNAASNRGAVSKRAIGPVRQGVVAPRLSAYDRALGMVRQNPVSTRLSAYDAFTERGATVDAKGTEHVRMDRTHRGLRVIGGDMVVHSRAGIMKGVSQTLAKPLNVGVTPKLSADSAITAAGVHFGTQFETVPTASLVVFAARANPRLAYDVLYVGTKKDGTPTRMHYYVDAVTGAILAKQDDVHTGTLPGDRYGTGNPPIPPVLTQATGTGNSLFAGLVPQYTQWNATRRVYEMKDPTRGNTHISDMGNGYRGTGTIVVDADNKWGNGTQADRASAAVDAAYGMAKTWDYYKNTFGRVGIRGDGVGALGAVHYSLNYANAFWSNADFTMAFGDGDGTTIRPLVAIDIVGHEVSHGVTHATAGLIYAKESGGLNEATSDIFGAMVEYYANNAQQPPNYVIGEAIFITPAWDNNIRTMFKPSLDGISDDCFPSAPADYVDFFKNSKDPHYTSGVANHFFYLLAEGVVVPSGYDAGTPANLAPSDLVCNGNTGLVGIGRDAAAKIWYTALTTYMVSNTDYAGARAATLQAAVDLYGDGSANHAAVAAAWDAVNVH